MTCGEATPLAETVIKAWEPYNDRLHTITANNGKEFAKHEEIAKGLDVKVYFARPCHFWERGANENINGLIRQCSLPYKVIKPCHFVVGLFHIYTSQYWVLKQDVLWGL